MKDARITEALAALHEAKLQISTATLLLNDIMGDEDRMWEKIKQRSMADDEATANMGQPAPGYEARVHQFCTQREAGIPCCSEALDEPDA